MTPPVTCDARNIVLETITPLPDRSGFVLRLYEAHRIKGAITLKFRQDIATVSLCDLEGNPTRALKLSNQLVVLDVDPFQIVSLLVSAQDAGE